MEENKIDFENIEKKWQNEWEKAGIFNSDEKSKKKKYYVLEMFPYPSASGLHMGHALNYTIGDIYARFKRMNGFNVLYPMGFDAFGLPAENAAIKAGEKPKPFTEKAMENYERQMREIGLSYDWKKIVKTCTPEYYKWNQYFFLKFLENNLVYRKKAAVNFCEKCNTVLANEQVQGGKCWRHEDTNVEIKQLEQWFIKTTAYSEELLNDIPKLQWPERIKLMQENWIGKSYGVEINFEINGKVWPIFTTRPDTIYGVTFMVVSAQHPKLFEIVTKEKKKDVENFLRKLGSVSEKELEEMEKEGVFTGSYAINPITKEKVPVYAGNFVVADYGAGMVMAVPTHDSRDYDFAKKYNIPMKVVIEQENNKIICLTESLKPEFFTKAGKLGKISTKDGVSVIISEKVDEIFELAKTSWHKGNWYIHSEGKIKRIMFSDNKAFSWHNDKEKEEAKKHGLKLKIKKEQLDFDELRQAYTENGILVNSDKFNGMKNQEAKEKITEYIEEKKLGKKTINYKFRDWLVSRQRYWGTPIPIIYCDKCGIVPVPEKDLPVLLPDDVKFGEGNPLLTNDKFLKVKCPKCGKNAKRETDTMDTFFDSSWYYLRYPDNKNDKLPFDKKKVSYWMPVDQYIGGAEHACMHLIYARFFTKALRDMGYLNFDEPFIKLFNQGMLHGPDGEKMSKSKGNVVLPDVVSKKYGMDTARLFLMSQASPDKDTQWSDAGIEGSLKIINRIFSFFERIKIGKSSKLIESKINKAIKEITEDIENFRYNMAIIKLRASFDSIENEQTISKLDLENFLKLIHPFCPHISEELWHKYEKSFISTSEWPVADLSKIDEKLEQEEKLAEKLISDIRNIIKILETRNEKKKKVKIYTIPNELEIYKKSKEKIEKIFDMPCEILSIKDAKETGKPIKASPGKPGILFE